MHLIFDLRTIDDHFPGIARFGYELALALLDHADVELSVIVPSSPQTRFDFAPLHKQANVMRCDAGVFSMSQHWQIGRLIQQSGADVALFPYYVRPLWSPVPSMTLIYDAISWRVPETFSLMKRLQIRLFHHLAIARSQHVLTISRSAAADLVQFYSVDPARIANISVGVSSHFQPQSAQASMIFRHQHGLPERYIVYLASDKPHKNIPFLLDVWAQANTGDVGLVLGGRWFDPATEQLLQRTALQGRVWRMAQVSEADLPFLYSGALAMASPSRYEGFGLPPLEAIACGTPVIAANTSSLPEAVGDAGVLLPLNHTAWIQAIERMCHDQAWGMELTARTAAQAAKFRWADVANRVIRAIGDRRVRR